MSEAELQDLIRQQELNQWADQTSGPLTSNSNDGPTITRGTYNSQDGSDDGDKDKKKKKKEQEQQKYDKNDVTSLAFWTDWEGWLNATPVLGGAHRSGKALDNGDYGTAALEEGGAILDMFALESLAKLGGSAVNSLMNLFARKAAVATEESLVFTIIDQEGKTIIYSTKIGDEVIRFGGDITKTTNDITIKNFDIEGNLINKLGVKGVRDIINQFGKQQGVKEVIIEGAKRTTGANKGRIPEALKFIIK